MRRLLSGVLRTPEGVQRPLMLWGQMVATRQALDEVVVAHAAVRARHVLAVVREVVEALEGRQQRLLAGVALARKSGGQWRRTKRATDHMRAVVLTLYRSGQHGMAAKMS